MAKSTKAKAQKQKSSELAFVAHWLVSPQSALPTHFVIG
jgi:hypothetical protein